MAKGRSISREKLARVIVAVRKGNHPDVAARACGVEPADFRWLWSTAACEAPPPDADRAMWDLARWFRTGVEEAEAAFEVDVVTKIAAEGGMDARRELLSTRFRDRWGKPGQAGSKTAGDAGSPGAPSALAAMTDEQLKQRLRDLMAPRDIPALPSHESAQGPSGTKE